jgi:two-component system nitrogen regulation response regulator NtrX
MESLMANDNSDSAGASRILIVEDEQDIRKAFVDILEKSGYYCRTAGDGREALLLLAKDEFDLILSDLRMPGMDGLELLSETGGLNRIITTIVITAHADIELAVEATRLGAYDFLSKPVDEHRLRLAVARAIEYQRVV